MIVSIETDKSRIAIDDGFSSVDESVNKAHREMLFKMAYDYIAQRDLMLQMSPDGFVMPVSEYPKIALCGKEVAKCE